MELTSYQTLNSMTCLIHHRPDTSEHLTDAGNDSADTRRLSSQEGTGARARALAQKIIIPTDLQYLRSCYPEEKNAGSWARKKGKKKRQQQAVKKMGPARWA